MRCWYEVSIIGYQLKGSRAEDTIVIISYVGVMAVLPSFGLPVGIIAGATRRARASAFRYTGRYVDSSGSIAVGYVGM